MPSAAPAIVALDKQAFRAPFLPCAEKVPEEGCSIVREIQEGPRGSALSSWSVDRLMISPAIPCGIRAGTACPSLWNSTI
jgi:hypothetical protein